MAVAVSPLFTHSLGLYHGTALIAETEQQTAVPAHVFGIILYHFAGYDYLPNGWPSGFCAGP